MKKTFTLLRFVLAVVPLSFISVSYGQQIQPTAGVLPKAVVLDFTVGPRIAERRDPQTRELIRTEKEVKTEKDSRGWWFGRQDIYVNENVGRIASDLISEQIKTDQTYSILSRYDLKYYYADKKDLISKKLSLTGDDLKKSILVLDPVKVGQELGVQKVIVGHICLSELTKSRKIGNFTSEAILDVVMYDVATGRVEFHQRYDSRRKHSTQYFHYEKIAENVSNDLLQVQGRGMIRR